MNDAKRAWPLFLSVFVLVLLTIFYSYTQVDLNLTLSSNSVYQLFQERLTQVGYFKRPLSAILYGALVILWFVLQYIILHVFQKRKLSKSIVTKLLFITLFLIFAYPAFSHDIFNYMFDARILTKYGLDPHFFKALDFPDDTWTRFMRWTHRYYPYGPTWLWLTLIPSFLGAQKFVLTLFFFKLMFACFHFFNVWLVGKIVEWRSPKHAETAMLFYGFNPLVITESLISPHNEVMMWTGVLFSLYVLLQKKIFFSIISSIFSIGVKFLSLVTIPLFLYISPISQKFYKIGLCLWIVALVPLIFSREFYPWYFVPVIGWIALLVPNRFYVAVGSGLSVGLLFRYVPFLLYGVYGEQTFMLTSWWIGVALISTSVYYLLWSRSATHRF